MTTVSDVRCLTSGCDGSVGDSMPQRIRRTPIRTCVVCRAPSGKRQLIRIVRTPDGAVDVDPTGKRAGRGAYLCSKPECTTGPLASRQLSRAFGVPVSPEMIAAWCVPQTAIANGDT